MSQLINYECNYQLYGNKSHIKYFEIIKYLDDKQFLGSYFVIPINLTDTELLENNLKNLQSDKDYDYFDINSRQIEYDGLSFFHPLNKYYINVSINLSELLNINFNETYIDPNISKKIQVFMRNIFSEYGNYIQHDPLTENKDYNIIIFDTKKEVEIILTSLKYFGIHNQGENQFSKLISYTNPLTGHYTNAAIYIWKLENNKVVFWWEDFHSIQISKNYLDSKALYYDIYNYCNDRIFDQYKEDLINECKTYAIDNNYIRIYYWLIKQKENKIHLIQNATNQELIQEISEYTTQQYTDEYLKQIFDKNDLIIFLSQEAITKLVSNKSNLYLFFDSMTVREYDDFSISQEKFNVNNETTFSNKYYYLKMKTQIWDSYLDLVRGLGNKNNQIYKNLKNTNLCIITSNTPLQLIKGTQPNYLYEQFKISPFIQEKKLLHFENRKINEDITMDYGKRFKIFRDKDFEIQKGIIPYTFGIFLQKELNHIDYSIFYKSNIFKTKKDIAYFSLIYDYPINQYNTEEIIGLLLDPASEQSYNLISNQYNQDKSVTNDIIYNFNVIHNKLKLQLNMENLNRTTLENYLKDIGFDVEPLHYNVYGFLKSYDSLDPNLSNLVIGLIQYTQPQIFLFYKKNDMEYNNIILKNYPNMFIDFNYYIYINKQDIYNHRRYYKLKKRINVSCVITQNIEDISNITYLLADDYVCNINEDVLLINQHKQSNNGIYQLIYDNITNKKILLKKYLNEEQYLLINILNGSIYNNTDFVQVEQYRYIQNLYTEYKVVEDTEIDELILQDYLKYYKKISLIDNNEYVYIPFISKLTSVNKLNKYIDIDLKFQIYDIPVVSFGQVSTNRIFKDFSDNEIAYNIIEGNIPVFIRNERIINGYIPVQSFFVQDGKLKMLRKVQASIPALIKTNFIGSSFILSDNSEFLQKLKISGILLDWIENLVKKSIKLYNQNYLIRKKRLKSFVLYYILKKW